MRAIDSNVLVRFVVRANLPHLRSRPRKVGRREAHSLMTSLLEMLSACCQRLALDATAQISAFGKLKLTNCARPLPRRIFMRGRGSAGSITAVICKFILVSMCPGQLGIIVVYNESGAHPGPSNPPNRLATLSFRSDVARPGLGNGPLLFTTGGQPSPSVRPSVLECLVPLAGLEPAQPCDYLILSQARLPIPPQGHAGGS
jgi:hypothetical protein